MRARTAQPAAWPEALVHYWTMWNEPDLELVRTHLDRAVSSSFVFSDPRHHHVGRDALEANVRSLRSAKPHYRFVIATELDEQHGCYRYRWHMTARGRVLLVGLDIALLDDDGLLERVDGFFGPMSPVLPATEGGLVPGFLRSDLPT